jgi:hypothetical protein
MVLHAWEAKVLFVIVTVIWAILASSTKEHMDPRGIKYD